MESPRSVIYMSELPQLWIRPPRLPHLDVVGFSFCAALWKARVYVPSLPTTTGEQPREDAGPMEAAFVKDK